MDVDGLNDGVGSSGVARDRAQKLYRARRAPRT